MPREAIDDYKLKKPRRCGGCGQMFERWPKDSDTCRACVVAQDEAGRTQRYLAESDIGSLFGSVTSKPRSKPR